MDREKLLEFIDKNRVRFLRLQFTDINGTMKNVEIPSDEVEGLLDSGIMFDGSSVQGFARIHESDMYLKPDLRTVAMLPWTFDGHRSARIICDVYEDPSTPFDGDPRYRLKLIQEKARSMGFIPYAGPEVEFFILPRKEGKPVFEFLDSGSYFDLLPVDIAEHIRTEVSVYLEEMGLDVETTHHEVAPSQHEVDFRYAEPVIAADNVQTVKLVIKTLAIRNNLFATFMPKPFFGVNGSGMHVHMSLFTLDGRNAFYDPDAPDGISQTMRYFIGGLIAHAREITAITNPTVNSYKRLVPGYEAPVNIAWSKGNRTALIRVPKARGNATRLEYRAPDPSCNPYLALAVMFAAGLDGIEKRIEPPLPVEENIYKMSDAEKQKRGISRLPANLKEALTEAEKSELVKSVLGEHIFEKFMALKEREWWEYSTHISEWERIKYENI
ncbi:type I glutamate--ammonia ligase [Fervidobacterium thailandense]|uniref:Glutamine synthetase n=2 Tax=Fervidobacterium thailandense TaxID=1008305 RepID=A0A1E3G0S6_9BACT|nr:type I glutamate--ammonia ligase [Fervidobacterium thailandense]ODN29851.1 type I glutamate--ammonia ligase [Fervidobacterium thailandense]